MKGSKGNDLHGHLQAVMKKLILHYPNNALDKLEEVSYLIKNEDTLKMEDFLKIDDFRSYKDVCGQMQDYIKKMKDQFPKKVEGEEGGDDAQPEEAPPIGAVPDLLADSQMYQWAGIGFG